jgi:hypothetical protein
MQVQQVVQEKKYHGHEVHKEPKFWFLKSKAI